jgi:hypothetical protein
MNLLNDIITYVRRIIKSPSNAVISDNLIIDYINRFWLLDVDARIQLFDLKTKYQFQTQPGVDQYNMPLYQIQQEGSNPTSSINYYPVYQGFFSPSYINGIQVPIQTEQTTFFNIWPDIVQQLPVVAVGTGVPNDIYNFQFPIVANFNTPPNPPTNGILRGHVDMTGIVDLATSTGTLQDPPVVSSAQAVGSVGIPGTIEIIPTSSVDCRVWITTQAADGSNVVVTDSGQFQIGNVNNGLLIQPGAAPNGNSPLPGGYGTSSNPSNVINYLTGEVINLQFPVTIPLGNNINAQCFFFQSGLPRGILYYNNSIILRSPPDQQYLVNLSAYLTPCAYLNTGSAIQFAYMSEYIARGAARKILADTGDIEQFQFYEPLFREQEILVWKRSQRQFTATRTGTIYSEGISQGQQGFSGLGGSTI